MQFSWKKQGRIFTASNNNAWMSEYAQVPIPFVYDSFMRIFFTTRFYEKKNNLPVSSIGYIDVKKDNFENIIGISKVPVLQHGKLGSFDEFGQMPAYIIKMDENLHFMYYTGWSRSKSVPYTTNIGLAYSKDGCKTFKKMFDGPVLGLNKYDTILVNGPSIIKDAGIYHMFYSSATEWMLHQGNPEVLYLIKHATSDDGINWKIRDEYCIPKLDEIEVQNSPRISKLNGKYYLWFCYRNAIDFREKKGNGYRLALAISDNLEKWQRMDESEIGISNSTNGWDSQMMCYPYMLQNDSELFLFYNGNYFGKDGFGYASTRVEEFLMNDTFS